MPERIYKTALASQDIEDLADYYLTEAGLTIALRFVDNAERAFARLADMPQMGALLGFEQAPYADIRRWHIEGFAVLLILYRDLTEGIEIVRVLRASRDIAALFLSEAPL